MRPHAILQDIRDDDFEYKEIVEDHSYRGANSDTNEHETDFANVEAVDTAVDEWEDFEEGVVSAINYARVNTCEQDSWILDVNFNRFDEGIYGNLAGSHIFLVQLRLTDVFVVAGEFSESFGATKEDIVFECFRHADEPEDEDGTGHPEDFPEGPSPAFGHDGETREEWSDCRGTEAC